MRFFSFSEAAGGHPNEDYLAVRSHPEDGTTLLCALADGMGGQAGAERAARLAVFLTMEIAEGLPIETLQDPGTWYQLVASVDQAVCDDLSAGSTTLVALCESGDHLCGASCGDSAVVLFQNGEATVLSDDHRPHNVIGSDEAIPEAFSSPLDGEWTLILMSDGVWKSVGFDEVSKMAAEKSGEDLILSLRKKAGERIYDDFSMIVVHQAGG